MANSSARLLLLMGVGWAQWYRR